MLRRLALAPALAGLLWFSGSGCNKDLKQPTVKDGATRELKPLPNPTAPGGAKAAPNAN